MDVDGDEMVSDTYDIIIIGGGPAGLTAAQYASRANLKVIILDRPQIAGALHLAGMVENYPGLIEPLTGQALLDIFRDQALKFGAIYEEEKVVGVKLDSEMKEVYGLKANYLGKAVIIASGSMARQAGIPGEAQYIGRGVSYCATCDAPFFRGLTVCVVGDTAEAVKEADYLAGFAKCVYLIMSRKAPEGIDINPSIHVITSSSLISIAGDNVVKRILVKRFDSSRDQQIETDGVFIYLHGAAPSVDFLDSSIATGDKACIVTHQSTNTSIPGVYAAGDVTCSAVRQVVVSAAYGCIAALEAEKYIRQRRGHRYDWSKLSDKGNPSI